LHTLIGKNLGKYRIVERLGHGGMADVYKAYHPRLDRYVAVKVLHSHLANDSEFLARFEREARAVANLRHPNIVQVFDFDIEDDIYYMVMEYVEGGTLTEHLQKLALKNEKMPLVSALNLFQQVSDALNYAHQQDMLHRDIKPANILLNDKGSVLLADFGIARIITDTRLTATGALIGTPAYMSPEQGLGEQATVSSEVYSLGVILYELVTGQVPFDADTPLAILFKHMNEPLPLPREVFPDIPNALEELILRSMAKKPEGRFISVAQMNEAVHQVLVALSTVPTMAALSSLKAADQETIIASGVSSHQVETLAVPSKEKPELGLDEHPSPIKGQSDKRKSWIFGAVLIFLTIVAGALIALKVIPFPKTTQPSVSIPIEGVICDSIPNCVAESEHFIGQQQHAEAIPYLDKAISFVPEDEQPFHAEFWCQRGEMHIILDDQQSAIDDFYNCAAWAAENEEMLWLHEDALTTAAELEHQLQNGKETPSRVEGEASQPGGECHDVEACRELAFSHAEEGRFEDAVRDIERALELRPSDEQSPFAHLWCHLGEFHLEMDRSEDAFNDFRTCLEWAGDGPGEEDLRNYAQEQLDQLDPSP
jgi:serine/threonine protein kinase